MVATHWVKVLATDPSTSRSLGIVLESSVTASETEGAALSLVYAAGSSVVA
jgi:hypothetical protein